MYVNSQRDEDVRGLMLSQKICKSNDQLKFKRLSIHARAPSRCTSGSVDYDSYSSENVAIDPLEKGLVPTDIVLICPKSVCPKSVYPKSPPRSSMAMKNADVGADVIDIDYRGNIKVVILNHSKVSLNI